MADASASAVQRLAHRRRRSTSRRGWRARRGRAPPPSRSMPREVGQPVDRHERLGQRRLALAGADHQVGAAGDGRAPPARRVPASASSMRRRPEVSVAAHASAPAPRPTPARASSAAGRPARRSPWRSRSRSRPASARSAARRCPSSRFGPAVGASVLDQDDLDRRRVGHGLELVVEQVRVALAAVLAEERALEHRLPDAHHDAALDLALGADRVQDRAASRAPRRPRSTRTTPVSRSTLTRTAWVKNGRRGERLASEPADAAGGVDVRRRRRRAGARPSSSGRRAPSRRASAIGDRRSGEPLTRDVAVDQLDVARGRLELAPRPASSSCSRDLARRPRRRPGRC